MVRILHWENTIHHNDPALPITVTLSGKDQTSDLFVQAKRAELNTLVQAIYNGGGDTDRKWTGDSTNKNYNMSKMQRRTKNVLYERTMVQLRWDERKREVVGRCVCVLVVVGYEHTGWALCARLAHHTDNKHRLNTIHRYQCPVCVSSATHYLPCPQQQPQAATIHCSTGARRVTSSCQRHQTKSTSPDLFT